MENEKEVTVNKAELTNLLLSASSEVEELRKRNMLQSARLSMFDDMMLLLRSQPPNRGTQQGAPDVVYDIKSYLSRNVGF